MEEVHCFVKISVSKYFLLNCLTLMSVKVQLEGMFGFQHLQATIYSRLNLGPSGAVSVTLSALQTLASY